MWWKTVKNNALFPAALICTVLFTGSMASSNEPLRPQDYFASPDPARVSDLANRWWQWVYAVPEPLNPRRDLTGAQCSVRQRGDVWFLADAETNDAVERKCRIPAGSFIFFPAISNVTWSPPYIERSCEEAKESAAFERSPNYSISVSLNGTPFPDPGSHLAGSSDCFDLLAGVPREDTPPSYYSSATDGYWFMLRPLPVGTHELVIVAEYHAANGDRNKLVDVRYVIEVSAQ